MADESMESVLERAIRLHQETMEKHAERLDRLDRSHADHEAHMARLDRNYDTLTQVALDIAATHDRLEEQVSRATRTQEGIARLLTETSTRITQNEEMLRQLIEMQRRRNGGQMP